MRARPDVTGLRTIEGEQEGISWGIGPRTGTVVVPVARGQIIPAGPVARFIVNRQGRALVIIDHSIALSQG